MASSTIASVGGEVASGVPSTSSSVSTGNSAAVSSSGTGAGVTTGSGSTTGTAPPAPAGRMVMSPQLRKICTARHRMFTTAGCVQVACHRVLLIGSKTRRTYREENIVLEAYKVERPVSPTDCSLQFATHLRGQNSRVHRGCRATQPCLWLVPRWRRVQCELCVVCWLGACAAVWLGDCLLWLM